MDQLVRLTAGAPASALLLAAILVFSALGLFAFPALIERNLLRPYGLAQRGDYLCSSPADSSTPTWPICF